MRSKFLLESFEEYISEVYSEVNESKVPGLSESEAKKVIEELVTNQLKTSLANSKITNLAIEIFGRDTVDRMRAANRGNGIFWADGREGIGEKSDKEKKEEFFKKIIVFDQKLNDLNLGKTADENDNYTSAVIMGLFYQFVTLNTKQELIKNFAEEASNMGLSAKKIRNQIENKINNRSSSMGQAPAILGYVDATEIEKTKKSKPKDPQIFSLLDEKNQKTLFIDNSWDLNPESSKILREQLSAVFERRKSGGYTKIMEFTIQSSASRYRNTGEAEKLSWGQLAFKRSQVIHNMVKEILDNLGIDQESEIRKELNSIAKIDISGSNGDGTSGPNPTGVRTGYYVLEKAQSKNQTGSCTFKDVEGSDKLMVTKIDGFGNPEGSPEKKEMSPLSSKEEYDKFKYVNVSVKIQEKVEVFNEKITVEKVPVQTIAPEIILDRRGFSLGTGKGSSSSSFKFASPIKRGLAKAKMALRGVGGELQISNYCGSF